jgi:hypothetical protein
VSILLDAGPCLNFLAVGQQNILVQVATSQQLQLLAPARVDSEIVGMCHNDRFKSTRVLSVWKTLKASKRVKILPDELSTRQFIDAVTRISGMPARDRIRSKRSLGEIMVLAHASVYVQRGHQVFVLIDDRDGRRRAGREAQWLRGEGCEKHLVLWSTPQVLQEAGRHEGWIKGDLTWELVYDQMTAYDDGLRRRSEWQQRS